jgi:hypothetical protein
MDLILERYAYLKDRTMGVLSFKDVELYTIERPWIPSPYHRGGKNFESCVPDGKYTLRPFNSTKHPSTFILENEDLDVFQMSPRGAGTKGRWAILIHVGNSAEDVVGCIAPGMEIEEECYGHVWKSRVAMDVLRDKLQDTNHTLIITSKGATNAQ